MGAFAEYLEKKLTFEQLAEERRRLLIQIERIRNRRIVVYASDLSKDGPTGIGYGDLLPFYEQIASLKTKNVDVLLETPGGDAVVVEDMVKRIRSKFKKFGIIVPGTAKSAGTIFAMAADEILMSGDSSLGPIDAQIVRGGKRLSASAFLSGLDDIAAKVKEEKSLNPIYIPILSNISPGEIEHCKNAQAFAQELVSSWLSVYKFRTWERHSDGRPVVESEKKDRAVQIARTLGDQSKWLTHGRSIHIGDLEALKLKVVNFDKADGCLGDAIRRYYTLLRLSFDSPLYKIFETSESHIGQRLGSARRTPCCIALQDSVLAEVFCPSCRAKILMQSLSKTDAHLVAGAILFPPDNNYACPKCGKAINLFMYRKQIVEIQRTN